MICEIVDAHTTRVTATLTTAEAAPLIQLAAAGFRVQARPVSNPYLVLDGRDVEIIETGRRVLPHAALGAPGGGTIAMDAEDRSGMQTKETHFNIRINGLDGQPGSAEWLGAPGERVYLRFTLPNKPLLSQWAGRLHRLVQGRMDI